MRAFTSSLSNCDVGNIQRVCVALSQCGEIIYNFVQVMDQLQMDIENNVCEPLKGFIEGELAMVSNGPKLETMRITASTNPKVSQVAANTQMAIERFELESLSMFTTIHDSFETFTEGFIGVNLYRDSASFAKIELLDMQKAYEQNAKNDTSCYRNYFGIPLKKLLDDENRMNAQIPLGLEKAFKYLYYNGLNNEGLFRVGSTPEKINYMKMKFLANNYINDDPYLVANTVKAFFREIPGSLIPKSAISSFLKWNGL